MDIKSLRPLSWSKLEDLRFNCLHRFKLKRIDKIKIPPNKPMREGDILHKFAAWYWNSCRSTNQISDLGIVDTIFDNIIANYDQKINDIDLDNLRELAHKIARSELFQLDAIHGIELKVALDNNYNLIDWDTAFELPGSYVGIIDKLFYDDDKEEAIIQDLKTGFGRKVKKDQLLLYAFLASKIIPKARFFKLIFQYIRPYIEEKPWIIHKDEIEEFIYEIEREIASYLEIEAYPAAPGPRCKKCEYAAICEYVGRDPKEISVNDNDAEHALRDAIHYRAKANALIEEARAYMKEKADALALELMGKPLKNLDIKERQKIWKRCNFNLDGEEVGYTPKDKEVWNNNGLFELLRKFEIESDVLINLDKRKLNALLRKNPEIAEAAKLLKTIEPKIEWSGT